MLACVDLRCQSVCVWKIWKKAFGDLDVFVGETAMPGKTSQLTQEYPNSTASRSLTKNHRAMAAATERG